MASYTIRVHPENGGPPTDSRFQARVVSVGRRKDNDLYIQNTSVSGRHGELRFDGRRVTFVDVGSSNGTFTDAGRVAVNQPVELSVGSRIRVGAIDLELVHVEVPQPAAPAPQPAAPAQPTGEEATSMLTAEQMRELLAAEEMNRGGGGGGAAPPQQHAPPPQRQAPPPQQQQQPRASAPGLQRRQRPPQQQAPPPQQQRHPEPMQPVGDHDDWADQAAGGQPQMQPVGGGQDDWAAQAAGGGGGGGQDDWAAQAAAGGGGGAAAQPAQAGGGGGGKLGGFGAPAGGPFKPSRPKPAPAGPPAADELQGVEEQGLVPASIELVKGAVTGAIHMFTNWGKYPSAGWGEIKSDFGAAWEVFKPTFKESPLAIGAVAATGAILLILALIITSLAGVFSLIDSLLGIVNIFAIAGTYVYFLRRRIGQPIGIIDAVKAVLGDWKGLILTLLICLVPLIPAAIAVLVPAMMLGVFILPIYYVEGRTGLATARRSLHLFKQDGPRIFLSVLTLAIAINVVTTVLVSILTGMGMVVAIIGLVIGAALKGITGAFMAVYLIELYFHVRARFDAGDAEQDALQNLGDG